MGRNLTKSDEAYERLNCSIPDIDVSVDERDTLVAAALVLDQMEERYGGRTMLFEHSQSYVDWDQIAQLFRIISGVGEG